MDFLRVHRARCTPWSPCKNCTAGAYLKNEHPETYAWLLEGLRYKRFPKTKHLKGYEAMPLPFDFHLDDCKPTSPCKNCELTKLVKSACASPELMQDMRDHLDGIASARKAAGEDETVYLTKHLPDCTPDKPCKVCQAVSFLQGRPGETAKIFKLLDPPIKTLAAEE